MYKLSNIIFESIDYSKKGEFIKSGLSRKVYKYESDKVLKLSSKNTWQNKNEIENYECLTDMYAARIYDYDLDPVDPKWIIAERADINFKKCQRKIAENLNLSNKFLKLDFDSFFSLLADSLTYIVLSKENYTYNSNKQDMEEFMEFIKNSSWGMGLVEKIHDCDVSPYDFHEENWGIRESTGEAILIDYGMPKYY